MERIERLKKSKGLVEAVLTDRTTVFEMLELWPEKVHDADHDLLENARWHLIYLSHDEDIMQHEPAYEERMLQTLRKIRDDISERVDALRTENRQQL